jgi:pentatricopeptide repeat protein
MKIGKFNEAVCEAETVPQSVGFLPLLASGRGAIYARAGRTSEARKVLDELRESALRTNVSAYCFAVIYLGLGEIDQALSDPLRTHPRWKALMRKMNLEPDKE